MNKQNKTEYMGKQTKKIVKCEKYFNGYQCT